MQRFPHTTGALIGRQMTEIRLVLEGDLISNFLVWFGCSVIPPYRSPFSLSINGHKEFAVHRI